MALDATINPGPRCESTRFILLALDRVAGLPLLLVCLGICSSGFVSFRVRFSARPRSAPIFDLDQSPRHAPRDLWSLVCGTFAMSISRFGCMKLIVLCLVLAGAVMTSGPDPASARTINMGDRSRTCLSTSIAPRNVGQSAACIAHNSCERTVFATFDAYPLHSRRTDAPVHAKVSHWLKPGDNEVFGWNSADPKPAPECHILDTHF